MGTDITAIFQKYENKQWITVESDFAEDRDYTLFAVLADQRNYDDIHPVLEPDFFIDSFEREEMGEQGLFYWLSDDILLDWYAQPHISHPVRYMKYEHYLQWDKKTEPNECARVTFLSYINMLKADQGKVAECVEVTWRQDVNARIAYFFEEVIRLKKRHGKIRFVFGFHC